MTHINTKIKKLCSILAISMTLLGLPGVFVGASAVYAAPTGSQQSGDTACKFSSSGAYKKSDCSCTGNSSCAQIYKYLDDFTNLLAAAVGIVAVAMIVYGGIEFSSSGGDPQKVASGKKHITNALIAIVAFLLLWAFLNFIIPGGLLNGS